MATIGVTGHRRVDDPEALAGGVDAALDALAARGGGEPATVVTSLAEGVDRLVARRGLARPGWDLEAILPLEPDDYARDFATDESRADFAELLSVASSVTVVGPQASRVDAYLAAGLAVLRRCDVVLAVWDGEPARGRGGTAEIVGRARAEALPLVWLRPDGSPAAWERLDGPGAP